MITLIPTPKKIYESGENIRRVDLILLKPEKHQNVARILSECGEEILGFEPGTRKASAATIQLQIVCGSTNIPAEVATVLKRSNEAYSLYVTKNGVEIFANTERVCVYAIHTVLAIAKVIEGEIELPVCEIHDWPDFRMRGLQDDPARGQVSTMDNFKRVIRELSRLKYNVMTFHMEDMIRFSRHPEIGREHGALDKSQWEELVEYGRIYGLEMFPTFQTFGHAGRVLSLPKYRKYAEFHDLPISYSPSVPGVYRLLDDFLAEIAEVFTFETIHIGCDEVMLSPKKGRSKDLVRKQGELRVYADHVVKVAALARKRWKNILFFADAFVNTARFDKTVEHNMRTIIAEVQRLHRAGLTFVNWNYYRYREEDYFPSINLLNRCEVSQVISPGAWDWGQIYPSFSEISTTLPVFTDVAFREGVKDAIVCSWGDTRDPFREDNYLNYAYSAEHLWNGGISSESQEQFTTRWAKQFFGYAPRVLVQALMWLGNLNLLVYDSARHDNRFPHLIDWSAFVAHAVFWNYPLPGSGSKEDAQRSKKRCDEAKQLINDLSSVMCKAKRNQFNINLLRYDLKRSFWLFESVQYCTHPTGARARSLVEYLKLLAMEFKQLWNVTNIETGREAIDKRFHKLITCYEREIQQPSRWDGKWQEMKRMI